MTASTPAPPTFEVEQIDPELKSRWVEALRSGHYTQSRGQLRSELGYCCLGVLCDVLDHDAWVIDEDGDAVWQPPGDPAGAWFYTYAPSDERTGLHHNTQGLLARINDDGTPFARIADWIEEHL